MTCQNTSPYYSTYLDSPSVTLHERTGYTPNTFGEGVFQPTPWNLEFNSVFYQYCRDWMLGLNHYIYTYGPFSSTIDWIGSIGVTDCFPVDSQHAKGMAFDLARIATTGPDWCDMNYSHQVSSGQTHRLRYIGIAAHTRRYFSTVITAWRPLHFNHIHFDAEFPLLPIRSYSKPDTALVQAACCILNNESIPVDSEWGQSTEDAYIRLRKRLKLMSVDPKASVSAAQLFMELIAKHGISGKPLGTYVGPG